MCFCFFKQKTAYEMRISDWSSDVCSSDLILFGRLAFGQAGAEQVIGDALAEVLDDLRLRETVIEVGLDFNVGIGGSRLNAVQRQKLALARALLKRPDLLVANEAISVLDRSEEHTSELQSLMRISYAVFCLKKKNKQ